MIDWNKPIEAVRTDDNTVHECRVLCRDRKSVAKIAPVLALVQEGGNEACTHFNLEGRSLGGLYQLRNVRKKGEFFVINKAGHELFGPWDYEDEAIEWAKKKFDSLFAIRCSKGKDGL